MIVAGREEQGRQLDLAQIDRRLADLDAAGIAQAIPLIHVAQVKAVHGAGHAGAVRIPIEQVERQRILSQQIVLDGERPDQIVLAQHREGDRHVLTVEEALVAHMLLHQLQLVLVDEDRQIADIGEIQETRQEGGAGDALVALGRQIGQRRGQQGSADAEAQRVDLGLADRLLDGVQRLEHAFGDIILEIEIGQALIGIDPRDQEHRIALVHRPFDVGILRLEVEDIEFVDPGRHDQQRIGAHRLGGRAVLDQLQQPVLEHHLAGAGGDVLADAEGRIIGHLDREAPLVALEILQQIGEAPHQILAPALDGGFHHLGIGQGEVRG